MSLFDDLKGKRVLVTGGSTGLGAAVAKAFADHGSEVAVHYNSSKAEAEKIVDDIKKGGGKAVLVQGDMTKPGASEKVVKDAVAGLGGLDVLVNNAGHYVVRTSFAEYKDEDYEKIMALNVRSMLNASRESVPHLKKSGKGAIINLGSIAGRNGGRAGSGIYAAAKGQIHTLTKGMANEWGPEIRVNTIAPGLIITPFHKETPKERIEQVGKSVPLKRVGQPEDLIGAYLFLASYNCSGYITGAIIDVNGGAWMP